MLFVLAGAVLFVGFVVVGAHKWHVDDKKRIAEEEAKEAAKKAAAAAAEKARLDEEEYVRRRDAIAAAAKEAAAAKKAREAAEAAKAEAEKVPAPDFQTFADHVDHGPVVLTVETPASDVVSAPKPKRTRKKKADPAPTEGSAQ